jgi:hypothetical protein
MAVLAIEKTEIYRTLYLLNFLLCGNRSDTLRCIPFL